MCEINFPQGMALDGVIDGPQGWMVGSSSRKEVTRLLCGVESVVAFGGGVSWFLVQFRKSLSFGPGIP
jgi:hypothetical protein